MVLLAAFTCYKNPIPKSVNTITTQFSLANENRPPTGIGLYQISKTAKGDSEIGLLLRAFWFRLLLN